LNNSKTYSTRGGGFEGEKEEKKWIKLVLSYSYSLNLLCLRGKEPWFKLGLNY
jgi:hypothetical protein